MMENQKIGWEITSFADYVKVNENAKITADMIVLHWKELDRAMQSIIGKVSINALFHRCIEITSADYPWLAAASTGAQSAINFELFSATFSKQDPVHVAAAGDLLLLNFHHLLADLIGSSLTERLLRPLLDSLLNGTVTKDI